MKAIILAAGMGTRMDKYTKDIPKCMLNFNGKTLIERQIGTLRSCGITEIIVVKGYMQDKIKIEGVRYFVNEDYKNSNMVETLMCAEEVMDDDILICYGDILYEKRIINKILGEKIDIGIAVDEDYLGYWKERLNNWNEDIESLVIGPKGNIVQIGNPNCSLETAKVRYVGLIKLSKKGVIILKKIYYENKKKYFNENKKVLNSVSFKKLYMTDMVQLIINSGQRVDPIIIKNGWLEFDTNKDYEKSKRWVKEGNINRFFDLEG